jgi:hypothetical protein
MDPVKIIIFVAAFLLLLLLGRKLSGAGESQIQIPPLPEPPSPQTLSSNLYEIVEEEKEPAPAVIGADIPFPVAVPPITRSPDGRYSRPEFLNYHFETIDLVTGPTDPSCFYDHLWVQTRDLDHGFPWTNKFTVATPAGLERVMKEEALAALYLDSETIIVPKWNLEAIMGAMVQQVIKAYREPNDAEEPAQSHVNPES